jgi:rhodanese-related sulfurtransferase
MTTTAERAGGEGKKPRPSVLRAVMAQAIFLVGLALLAAFVSYRLSPTAHLESPREIALEEIPAAFPREKILWIDARPAAAFAEKHLPGAVWLAEEAWEEGLPKFVEAWTPGQPIVVYCSSLQCGSSHSVARRLVREFNATRVHYLKGGWDALQTAKP